MKKHFVFSVAFSCLISLGLHASPQVPDFIIFRGDTIATYNLLLESYLQQSNATDSGELFGLSFRESASTNCWRGYQAIYKIENDSLFLVNIIACGELRNGQIDVTSSLQKMKIIFGEFVKNEKVHINWFSGDLNFPLNNKLLRWDGVFYSIYENETVVKFDTGIVLSVDSVANYVDDPKGIDRRDKDKVSNILFKKLQKAKWQGSDECDCSEKYLITIDSSGQVSKVTMIGYDTDQKINQFWDRAEFDFCIRTILTTLSKMKFDVIKDKGIPISEDIYLEIWVTDRGRLENWTN